MDHSQSVGPLGWVTSHAAGLLPTQVKDTENMRTDMHVSSGILTYDPEVLTGGEISWLRPQSQCENWILFLQILTLISDDVAEIRQAKKSYILIVVGSQPTFQRIMTPLF